tara:strand:+ start:1591 stop:2109 length:519 start_codon:yes stop_codon:yes gene_type:complete
MKNILFTIALLISFSSFGQDLNLNVDKKVEFSEKSNVKQGLGYNYLGSGVYSFSNEGKSSASFSAVGQKRGIEKEKIKLSTAANNAMEQFASNNEWSYKVVSEEVLGGNTYRDKVKVIITFQVFSKEGSLVINKSEAKQQILELKEYLDLGIITQEEFDAKAVSLKKILLGN